MRYISSPDFHRDGAERIGILLVNSGTPAAPEAREVRKFLAKFLGDPRVVEIPRALWLPIPIKGPDAPGKAVAKGTDALANHF